MQSQSADSVEKRTSFDFIRYANCWEDADILCEALDVGEGDRVLSVASAGDNALALLATGAEVVAADLNPAQIACTDLRRVAFDQLPYEQLLEFFDIASSTERLPTYRRLRSELTPLARDYWDNHTGAIRGGIIHAGKFERYFHIFRSYVLPLMHSRRTVVKLLEPKSRGKREAFYENTWNNWRWQLLFRIFFSRFVMGKLGRDPEFFRYVEGPVSSEILRRTRHALVEIPTHDNPYLEYILTGNFERTLPRYLRRDNYEAIRDNLDNLTLVNAPIQDAALEHNHGGFDAFNLSDIFEYLDSSLVEKIFGDLLAAANPSARLAYWNMMVPRRCSDYYPDSVEPKNTVARELHERDRAFFYRRFVVEVVR